MNSAELVDPHETVLTEQKLAGEILVSQLRILGLLLVAPPSLVRIFGYGILDYLPWGVVQWCAFMLYSLGIYVLLRRGVYHPLVGYLTLLLDLLGLAFSMVLFSFFSPQYGGVFKDSLFVIYYIVAVSSALRFDYRYSVFCVVMCTLLFGLQALVDLRYHQLELNLYYLGECYMALVAITGLSILMAQRFRKVVLSGYDVMARRIKEISAIMKIGRNIARPGELEKKLNRILSEAADLLQSDSAMLGVLDEEGGRIERLLARGDNSPALQQAWLNPREGLLGGLFKGRNLVVPRAAEGSPGNGGRPGRLLGVPLRVDGKVAGAVVLERKTAFNRYDEILLSTLAEQAAVTILHMHLFETLKGELERHPGTAVDQRACFEGIIGRSGPMQQVFRLIEKAAVADIPVLVRGESGTGKELVAQALHRLSPRHDKPFIKINCAAIPESLLESELFGYEKGAFTGAYRAKKGKFERAAGGSVFLDEIGDMSLNLQTKLLRVIQEKTFERVGGEATLAADVRIISATNQDLEERIAQGCFREDLFYRINALPICVPPLRERRDDIPLLVTAFIERHANGRNLHLSRCAMNHLVARPWRGNVRELENLVQRLVVICEPDTIKARDIAEMDAVEHVADSDALGLYVESAMANDFTLSHEIARVEEGFIRKALLISGGNIREASRILNMPKSTLFNKINKYDSRG